MLSFLILFPILLALCAMRGVQTGRWRWPTTGFLIIGALFANAAWGHPYFFVLLVPVALVVVVVIGIVDAWTGRR